MMAGTPRTGVAVSEYPIVIRAITSDDAMMADWARLSYDLLERISNRSINEVPGGTGSPWTSPARPWP